MEWLAHDEVPEGELPEWTREGGEALGSKLAVHREGIVHRGWRKATALPWTQVLTIVRLDHPARVLICAPRKPPRVPWIAVEGPEVSERLPAIYEQRRSGLSGYRSGPRSQRDRLSPEEVLARVLRHEEIPGAVEVPYGADAPSIGRSLLHGGAFGIAAVVSFAPALVAVSATLAAVVVAGASVLGVGGHYGMHHLRHARRGRVLVMTPDAFVGGLDGGAVRAFGWEAIRSFRTKFHETECLEVVGPDDRILARVPERFFGVELEVIVAIAESYGARVRMEAGLGGPGFPGKPSGPEGSLGGFR
jgi:hypothetical protein